MTAHTVFQAFNATEENRRRLAYRTAYYTQRKMDKDEADFFTPVIAVPKQKRQSLKQQYLMARTITKVMVH